jgi:hypothetical protein
MIKISSTWIRVSVGTSNHWLSRPLKGAGAVANVLTHIKIVLMKCLFIIGWSGMEFLSIPTDKNLKDWGRANLGAVPWKTVSRLCWYERFSLFSCGGTHSRNFFKHFTYTPYIQTTSPPKLLQHQLGCNSFNSSDGCNIFLGHINVSLCNHQGVGIAQLV